MIINLEIELTIYKIVSNINVRNYNHAKLEKGYINKTYSTSNNNLIELLLSTDKPTREIAITMLLDLLDIDIEEDHYNLVKSTCYKFDGELYCKLFKEKIRYIW